MADSVPLLLLLFVCVSCYILFGVFLFCFLYTTSIHLKVVKCNDWTENDLMFKGNLSSEILKNYF